MFRGEGSAAWSLVPSAYRATALLYDGHTMTRGLKRHILAQIDAEWRTLRLFLAQVDRSGLAFATPDAALFDYEAYMDKYGSLMSCIRDGSVHEWPPSELLPNLGLAQHYGVHTRLLDWSTSLQAAGYFATAKGAELFKTGGDTGAFTLWALRRDFLDHAANKQRAFARIVRVPRSSNQNLHAQDGVFINYRAKPEDPFVAVPFDRVVEDAWAQLLADDAGRELPAFDPPLIRVDVPWRWAGVILRELTDMGWGPTRYFPGYAGAARAAQERELWI